MKLVYRNSLTRSELLVVEQEHPVIPGNGTCVRIGRALYSISMVDHIPEEDRVEVFLSVLVEDYDPEQARDRG